jgi:glycine cleavage system T protein (aminomethyltransferase)
MVTFDVAFNFRALRRDYGDIFAEAASCRSAAALFDFSFMQRIRIRGPRATLLIAMLTPRRMDDLLPGRIRYALAVDALGRVLGDLTVWRLDAETFDIFVPPGNTFTELQTAADLTSSVCDLSHQTAIFAVQGPASLRVLAAVSEAARLSALPYFGHLQTTVAGVECCVGRLGYTGERGFEIILSRAASDVVWRALAHHARPAGFAAADILRIEAGFPLLGNEFRFPVTADELGLERFADAGSTGRSAPRAKPIRLTSFQARCDHEHILWQPLEDAPFPPDRENLVVTSACRSAIAGGTLGLGYAMHGCARLVDPSGQFREIRRVALPFYDPDKRRPRGGWRDDLSPDEDRGYHSLYG